VLSSFTHLWNAAESPSIHGDEGHYIRRALFVSEGNGPQEPTSNYDHPYYGWLMLGSILGIVDYPNSLNPQSGDQYSVEMVWSLPRLVMGIIAVFDTFLIYKIAEHRYGRKVAFIAAVLFAVMPYSWMLRRVFLESIQLPLLLLSVLFALYIKDSGEPKKSADSSYAETDAHTQKLNNNSFLLICLSGIFLGLAVFTKLPAFTITPLIGYLIFKNTNRSLKGLGVWFVPVVLIPLLWPAFATSIGEFDGWLEGLDFQATRVSKPLYDSMISFYHTDPILLIIGVIGVVFAAAVRRDVFFLIWILPFLVFLYLINYVSFFHLIILIPAFSIAAAAMIADLSDRLPLSRSKRTRRIKQLLPYAIVTVIGVFGMTNTIMSIFENSNSSYFKVVAAVTEQLPTIGDSAQSLPGSDSENDGNNGRIEVDSLTVIGSPSYYWILQYVYDKPQYNYKTQYNLISKNTVENIVEQSEKVIIIADRGILEIINKERLPETPKDQLKAERLSEIYGSTNLVSKVDDIEIRRNY
jgi:Ca2+/Na+ antiporter